MKICVFGNKSATSELLKYLTSNNTRPHTLATLSKESFGKIEISGSDVNICSQAESLGH